MGLQAIGFSSAPSRLMTPLLPTRRSRLPIPCSINRRGEERCPKFQLIAVGFTEAGRRHRHRDSRQPTLESKVRFSETMSTKLSFRRAQVIGHSGAAGVSADKTNSIQPGLFFGKGFDDVPDWLAWARPFAVTGAIVDEFPIGGMGNAITPNPTTGRFQTIVAPQVETLHWGFSIQYSTLYRTSRSPADPRRRSHKPTLAVLLSSVSIAREGKIPPRPLIPVSPTWQLGNLVPHVAVPAVMPQHLMSLWALSGAESGFDGERLRVRLHRCSSSIDSAHRPR
jgi:hypothetical protein